MPYRTSERQSVTRNTKTAFQTCFEWRFPSRRSLKCHLLALRSQMSASFRRTTREPRARATRMAPSWKPTVVTITALWAPTSRSRSSNTRISSTVTLLSSSVYTRSRRQLVHLRFQTLRQRQSDALGPMCLDSASGKRRLC